MRSPPQDDSDPPNSRIFLGNLPSERTSRDELYEIFSKYGTIKEVIMRRSFGFIQFETEESARAAIAGEQGRTISGMRIGNVLEALKPLLSDAPLQT